MTTKKTRTARKPPTRKPAKPRTIKVVEDAADQAVADTPVTTPPAAKARKESKAQPQAKRMSAIDAAAKVLTETREPMNAKQLINVMITKGYWTSPAGKTPHATLYSAILREIGTKGNDARFKKTERGKFAANG